MNDRNVHLTLSPRDAEWLKTVVAGVLDVRGPLVLDKIEAALANHERRKGALSDEDVLDTLLAEVERHALGRVRRTTTEGQIVHFDAPMFEVAARLDGLQLPVRDPRSAAIPPSENSLRLRVQKALARIGWTCAAIPPMTAKYGLVNSTLFTFHRNKGE